MVRVKVITGLCCVACLIAAFALTACNSLQGMAGAVFFPAAPPKAIETTASANSQPEMLAVSASDTNSRAYDVDADIRYRVTVAKELGGVDSNILRAARQAMFEYSCDHAISADCNRFSADYDVYIYDVIENGGGKWEVRFYEKRHGMPNYDTGTYCSILVTREDSGSYTGEAVTTEGA